MFKVAFHGGFNNVWNGVMTIPEVCNKTTFFSLSNFPPRHARSNTA